MRYADIITAVAENEKRSVEHRDGVNATIAESARLHKASYRKYYVGENVVLIFKLNGGLSFEANKRMGFFETSPSLKFSAAVLAKAAEVAAEVEKWIQGERDELPPSTWEASVWSDGL
jgi:hypothetical protein